MSVVKAISSHGREPIELQITEAGSIAIYHAGVQIGELQPTNEGLRLILGDADPGGGVILAWTGEPFSMRFDLRGGTS